MTSKRAFASGRIVKRDGVIVLWICNLTDKKEN